MLKLVVEARLTLRSRLNLRVAQLGFLWGELSQSAWTQLHSHGLTAFNIPVTQQSKHCFPVQ